MSQSTQNDSLPLVQSHTTVLNQNALHPVHYSAKLYAQPMSMERNQNVQSMCLTNEQMSQQSQMALTMNSYASSNHSIENSDHPKKRLLKERGVGRRLHDYNKVQATLHQTNVYNQVLSQQHNSLQQQQQQSQSIDHLTSYNHSNYPNAQNVIQQHMNTPVIQTTTNSYALDNSINALNLSNNMQMNSYHTNAMQTKSPNSMDLATGGMHNQSLMSLLSNNKSQDVQLDTTESYKSVSYKPYPQKPMKMTPSSNSGKLKF